MSVLVLFLAICTWTANAASTGASDGLLFRPDYTFDNEAGGWLKFHPIPKQWRQAALRCHHEGVPISNMCLTWSAEPNINDSNPSCIAMNANGTVTAVPCLDHHPFFCYRKKGVSVLNKCGTVDPEYVFNPKTGSCYKTSKVRLTWKAAYTSCATDGAHLAVINSEEEAQILSDLRRKTFEKETVHAGILSWDREWITVQGQSLKEAGYAHWRNGEPNNVGGVEDCGSMVENDKDPEAGILNDVPCDGLKHYICEIEA
ncbi:hypothetical protein ABMA28_014642 [Loxostege sticticalis]|uniref:C-type lectin domain-containing protein n=1 Tax=Loxostege sticticalis TaxID=481309 RepID=A0ABD0TBR2_LOXSC